MIQSRTAKAAIFSSGQFLSACASLITFAVLSRVLTKTDYATYRQTILAYHFVVPLLMLGLPQALYYFLPNNQGRARGVLKENLLVFYGAALLFTLFLLCGGSRFLAWRFSNPDLERTLFMLAPYPLLMLPMAAVSPCLMACDLTSRAAAFNIINKVLILVAVVGAALIWQSPSAAVAGHLVGAGLVVFPAYFLMLRATSGTDPSWSMGGSATQLKYSVPIGLGTMISSVALGFDKIIVASMRPAEEFAVYANGAFEIPLIGIVAGSVTAVLLPELSKMLGSGVGGEALDLWKRSACKCAALLYPAAVFMFIMAPDLITLLFSEAYSESTLVFRVYLLVMPFRVVTFMAIIIATGKSRWILYRSLGDLVLNPLLCFLFVRKFGYIGAAVSTVLCLYVWTVPFSLYAIKREYRVKWLKALPVYDLVKIMAVSVLGSMVLAVNLLISDAGSVLRLVVSLPLYAAAVIVLFHYLHIYKISAEVLKSLVIRR